MIKKYVLLAADEKKLVFEFDSLNLMGGSLRDTFQFPSILSNSLK